MGKMKLESDQKDILGGAAGEAHALAIKTLAAYGEAFGANRLVPIRSAHLVGSFGSTPFTAVFDILERLLKDGARCKVPTTINPRPGADLNLPNRFLFGKQKRLEALYSRLGVTPNYSCVSYLSANVPLFGDVIAWAESSAVVFANSVIGARTNRNSLLLDICQSVTGLTPQFGYLLDENRRARVLVKLEIDEMDAAALGFFIGKTIVDKVAVLENYPFTTEELKDMGGAMAASGGVALYHVEGLTPEAPDMKTVFDGLPEKTITVRQNDLDSLRDGKNCDPDIVVFGCPQLTLEQARGLTRRFASKRIKKRVMFSIIPADRKKFIASRDGEIAMESGIEVVECCPLAALTLKPGIKTVLTNSGKLYYYLAGAKYGSINDCFRACGVA